MGLYSIAVRWRAEELRSLAFGDISGTYALLGSFDHPITNYKVSNFSDANIIVSYDGVNDHDVVAANGYFLLDVGSNKGKGDVLAASKGTDVYIKQESGAPTSGSVYLSSYYISDK